MQNLVIRLVGSTSLATVVHKQVSPIVLTSFLNIRSILKNYYKR